jgi:hypothetical protein
VDEEKEEEGNDENFPQQEVEARKWVEKAPDFTRRCHRSLLTLISFGRR